jgi:molybdate transport system permease protein
VIDRPGLLPGLGRLLGASLVMALGLPIVALVLSASMGDLRVGLAHPLFLPALGLSLRTTLFSLLITVVTGTPLAWWLATTSCRLSRSVELVVELPIVIPPAVVGVALL